MRLELDELQVIDELQQFEAPVWPPDAQQFQLGY